MIKVKLSEVIDIFPKGLGVFIGATAQEKNKRYCFGQPQLKGGKMVFVDSLDEGIEKFGLGPPEFPCIFIDCKEN